LQQQQYSNAAEIGSPFSTTAASCISSFPRDQ
jgi:hypothetical protein